MENGSGVGWGGFSLVEVMVCCALIGAFSVSAAYAYQEMIPVTRVNQAAREIASLMEWTRWQAVRTGEVHTLVVSPETERIAVMCEHGGVRGRREEFQVRELDLSLSYRGVVIGAPEGIPRTSGCTPVSAAGVHLVGRRVRFRPTGVPDRCGSIYLVPEKDLGGRHDRIRAVSLILATGRVQLWTYDPYGEGECRHAGVWLPRF